MKTRHPDPELHKRLVRLATAYQTLGAVAANLDTPLPALNTYRQEAADSFTDTVTYLTAEYISAHQEIL